MHIMQCISFNEITKILVRAFPHALVIVYFKFSSKAAVLAVIEN